MIIFGFILLNLTFLFDAIYRGLLRGFVSIFIPLNPETNIFWLPQLFHGSVIIIISIISWFVFKSNLKSFYKATYMTVPLAVVYATIGIFFYQWQLIVYLLGTLFSLFILYYLYKNKQSWIYYYTLILITFTMFMVFFLRVEI